MKNLFPFVAALMPLLAAGCVEFGDKELDTLRMELEKQHVQTRILEDKCARTEHEKDALKAELVYTQKKLEDIQVRLERTAAELQKAEEKVAVAKAETKQRSGEITEELQKRDVEIKALRYKLDEMQRLINNR
ncbi:MAG: hypothetical protein JW909_04790 [Planctomycetes bacterium]|nr:hypothetical protein [Planctomycetota bacterium]